MCEWLFSGKELWGSPLGSGGLLKEQLPSAPQQSWPSAAWFWADGKEAQLDQDSIQTSGGQGYRHVFLHQMCPQPNCVHST